MREGNEGRNRKVGRKKRKGEKDGGNRERGCLATRRAYPLVTRQVPLSCLQSHWRRLQGWPCLGLKLLPASSSAQCSPPSHLPTSWLPRAVYRTCDLPLVARGEMEERGMRRK